MTSLERLRGAGGADLGLARERATAALAAGFGYHEVRWATPADVRAAAGAGTLRALAGIQAA
jgi:hypothetical protein